MVPFTTTATTAIPTTITTTSWTDNPWNPSNEPENFQIPGIYPEMIGQSSHFADLASTTTSSEKSSEFNQDNVRKPTSSTSNPKEISEGTTDKPINFPVGPRRDILPAWDGILDNLKPKPPRRRRPTENSAIAARYF